jgi:hypothetical protein
MKPTIRLAPDATISITVEDYQVIGNDTLRLDLSFVADIHQDGKELTLSHERQTVYINKKRAPLDMPVSDVLRRKDQRQKGSI